MRRSSVFFFSIINSLLRTSTSCLAIARSLTILLKAILSSPISSLDVLITRCVRSPSPTLLAASRRAKTGIEILRDRLKPIIIPIANTTKLKNRDVSRICFLLFIISLVVVDNKISPLIIGVVKPALLTILYSVELALTFTSPVSGYVLNTVFFNLNVEWLSFHTVSIFSKLTYSSCGSFFTKSIAVCTPSKFCSVIAIFTPSATVLA